MKIDPQVYKLYAEDSISIINEEIDRKDNF